MNSGTLIWMIIFGIFAVMFFVIAAVVSIKGIADIKELRDDPDLQSNE